MAMQTSGGLDFETLRRAIEGRDAETLAGHYADDAEVLTINRNTTPSSPQVLRGKEQISEYLRDVCSREMTHRVENEVVAENRIAFQEACEYPDGVRVLGAQTLDLNAWCELSLEDLRGRCPHSRVGLLPNPKGKGTALWSMWTPSSLHFTLWLTISATPIRQTQSLVRKLPSPPAR
jgi:hypothetical protein